MILEVDGTPTPCEPALRSCRPSASGPEQPGCAKPSWANYLRLRWAGIPRPRCRPTRRLAGMDAPRRVKKLVELSSLLRRENSLFFDEKFPVPSKKFPVPLRREFCRKLLKTLVY